MSDAKKYDTNKPRVDLIPTEPVLEIAKVLSFGASKYGDHNWRRGMAWSRIYAATQRHLMKWNAGQEMDEESGESHLAHAAVNLIFLLYYNEHHKELDDRYKP